MTRVLPDCTQKGQNGKLVTLPWLIYIDAYDGEEAYTLSIMTNADENLYVHGIVYKEGFRTPQYCEFHGKRGDESKLVEAWLESLPADLKNDVSHLVASNVPIIYHR